MSDRSSTLGETIASHPRLLGVLIVLFVLLVQAAAPVAAGGSMVITGP